MMRMVSFGSGQGVDDFQAYRKWREQNEPEPVDSLSSSQETIRPPRKPADSPPAEDWLETLPDEFTPVRSRNDSSASLATVVHSPKPTFQDIIQQTLERLHESFAAPPQESVKKIRPRKVEVAGKLADWMRDTLAQEGVQVAVVARQGGLQHKKHDKTGMFHTGIALFHPRDKKWKIYNLVDEQLAGSWQGEVQWTEPEDFFYQQGGYHKKSLLLIPDQATQLRMRKALLKGDYKKLFFTSDYNLVSEPAGKTSLNCNKWVLLNVLAAKRENYNPMKLLDEIGERYRPDRIDVHPLIRPIAKYQPHIKPSEIPLWGPIHTVTVNSLVESGLFERTLACDEPETNTLVPSA